MKLPSKDDFFFKECVISEDPCWLITPKAHFQNWTEDVARFRSVIIRQADHHVISQGFRKFMNYGERPSFEPWDDFTSHVNARQKIDGSLLMISKYKGELVIRTRGTTTTETLGTAKEIEFLKQKYPKVFDNDLLNLEEHTYLYEWTTPNNVIVLRESDEPTLHLIGIVRNEHAFYCPDWEVDWIASMLKCERPKGFQFDSIDECYNIVKHWTHAEGVVIYSKCGQILKKIKSDRYNELHRKSSKYNTLKSIIDFTMSLPPEKRYADAIFEALVIEADYEIAERARSDIYYVDRRYHQIIADVSKVEALVVVIKLIRNKTHREKVELILTHTTPGFMQTIAFNCLNNKHERNDEVIRRLMQHEIK
jgi:hypothetical protein